MNRYQEIDIEDIKENKNILITKKKSNIFINDESDSFEIIKPFKKPTTKNSQISNINFIKENQSNKILEQKSNFIKEKNIKKKMISINNIKSRHLLRSSETNIDLKDYNLIKNKYAFKEKANKKEKYSSCYALNKLNKKKYFNSEVDGNLKKFYYEQIKVKNIESTKKSLRKIKTELIFKFIFYIFSNIMNGLSIMNYIIQTYFENLTDNISLNIFVVTEYFEVIFSYYFFCELLLYLYRNFNHLLKKIFCLEFLIDFITIFPPIISSFLENKIIKLQFIRALRIFRVFRILRIYKTLKIIQIENSLNNSENEGNSKINPIKLQFYIILIVLVSNFFICAGLILGLNDILENAFNKTNINFFDALYFIIVTTSTLGYGDIVPTHPISRFLIITSLFSLVLIVSNQLTKLSLLLKTWGPNATTYYFKNHFILVMDSTISNIFVLQDLQSKFKNKEIIIISKENININSPLINHNKINIIQVIEYDLEAFERANIKDAMAILIFTEKVTNNIEQKEKIIDFLILKINRFYSEVPIYLQTLFSNRSSFTTNTKKLKLKKIIPIMKIKTLIESKSLFNPGFACFIQNLIFNDKKIPDDYNTYNPLMKNYFLGTENKIIFKNFPNYFNNMQFTEAVYIIYLKSIADHFIKLQIDNRNSNRAILLIGISEKNKFNKFEKDEIKIFPEKYIIKTKSQGIFISYNGDKYIDKFFEGFNNYQENKEIEFQYPFQINSLKNTPAHNLNVMYNQFQDDPNKLAKKNLYRRSVLIDTINKSIFKINTECNKTDNDLKKENHKIEKENVFKIQNKVKIINEPKNNTNRCKNSINENFKNNSNSVNEDFSKLSRKSKNTQENESFKNIKDEFHLKKGKRNSIIIKKISQKLISNSEINFKKNKINNFAGNFLNKYNINLNVKSEQSCDYGKYYDVSSSQDSKIDFKPKFINMEKSKKFLLNDKIKIFNEGENISLIKNTKSLEKIIRRSYISNTNVIKKINISKELDIIRELEKMNKSDILILNNNKKNKYLEIENNYRIQNEKLNKIAKTKFKDNEELINKLNNECLFDKKFIESSDSESEENTIINIDKNNKEKLTNSGEVKFQNLKINLKENQSLEKNNNLFSNIESEDSYHKIKNPKILNFRNNNTEETKNHKFSLKHNKFSDSRILNFNFKSLSNNSLKSLIEIEVKKKSSFKNEKILKHGKDKSSIEYHLSKLNPKIQTQEIENSINKEKNKRIETLNFQSISQKNFFEDVQNNHIIKIGEKKASLNYSLDNHSVGINELVKERRGSIFYSHNNVLKDFINIDNGKSIGNKSQNTSNNLNITENNISIFHKNNFLNKMQLINSSSSIFENSGKYKNKDVIYDKSKFKFKNTKKNIDFLNKFEIFYENKIYEEIEMKKKIYYSELKNMVYKKIQNEYSYEHRIFELDKFKAQDIFSDHIIIIGYQDSLDKFVKLITYHFPNKSICYLGTEEQKYIISNKLLKQNKNVYFFQGDPINPFHLINAGLNNAFHVIFLCETIFKKLNEDMTSLLSSRVVDYYFDINMFLELWDSKNVNLLGYIPLDKNAKNFTNEFYHPLFMAGRVIYLSHLDKLTTISVSNPNLIETFYQIISVGFRRFINNFTDKRSNINLRFGGDIPVIITLDIPKDYLGKEYYMLVQDLLSLEKPAIPFGVYVSNPLAYQLLDSQGKITQSQKNPFWKIINSHKRKLINLESMGRFESAYFNNMKFLRDISYTEKIVINYVDLKRTHLPIFITNPLPGFILSEDCKVLIMTNYSPNLKREKEVIQKGKTNLKNSKFDNLKSDHENFIIDDKIRNCHENYIKILDTLTNKFNKNYIEALKTAEKLKKNLSLNIDK